MLGVIAAWLDVHDGVALAGIASTPLRTVELRSKNRTALRAVNLRPTSLKMFNDFTFAPFLLFNNLFKNLLINEDYPNPAVDSVFIDLN